MPNFIEIEETYSWRTYRRTDGHLRPTLLGRLRRIDLNTDIFGYIWLVPRTIDLFEVCKSVCMCVRVYVECE